MPQFFAVAALVLDRPEQLARRAL